MLGSCLRTDRDTDREGWGGVRLCFPFRMSCMYGVCTIMLRGNVLRDRVATW